jgi:hypothetical protein
MERLFALDPDPMVRVRIGDARRKLGQKTEAVKEYIHAADLYADGGFVVKALAQYKLALRLHPTSKDAQGKIESLHSNKTVTELKLEPIEVGSQQPTRRVIPLFSDFTQEEFNAFTKRMIIHTIPPGKPIINEGDKGRSVFILTRESVKVFHDHGKKWNLQPSRPAISSGRSHSSRASQGPRPLKPFEETDVLEVAEDDLNEMISKSPRIREVLHNYHEQRVKSTLEKVKDAL